MAPVVLLPLFLRSEPLPPGPLRDVADDLVVRSRLRVRDVRLLRLSEKTTASNAAVVGFGPTRRILLGDTLEGLDETGAVLAHELGHHAHRDLLRGLGLEAVASAVTIGVAAALLEVLPAALVPRRRRRSGVAAGLRALRWAWQASRSACVTAWHSRRRERAADAYAARLADPDAFARALERLVATNLAELEPPRSRAPARVAPAACRAHRPRPAGGRGSPSKHGRVSVPADSSSSPRPAHRRLRLADDRALHGARIMALANQKGGVAKTTSTLNLGVALQERGPRRAARRPRPAVEPDDEPGHRPRAGRALDVRRARAQDADRARSSSTREVDIAVASIDLAGAELALASMIGRERALEKALMPVRADYDYVLIDTPPSLGLLTINALTAASGVIVPVQCEYLSLRGLVQLEATLQTIRENLNPRRAASAGSSRRCSTSASCTPGRRSSCSSGTSATSSSARGCARPCGSPRRPVAGQSVIAYDPTGQPPAAYRELAEEVLSDAEEAG